MLEPVQRKARKLTRFLCEEMLYDYLSGRLDDERKSAVENFVKDNPDLQFEVKALRAAEEYCAELAKTHMAPGYIDELKRVRLPTETLLARMKWSAWPEFLKWTAEAMVISMAVAAIALVTPWEKLSFEFPKGPETTVTLAETSTPETTVPAEESRKIEEEMPEAMPDKKPEAEAITASETTASETTAAVTATAAAPAPPVRTAPLKGLLYRMTMAIPEVDIAGEDVKSLIVRLGGVKAGQVELGWRKRNPVGNYYHFTLPETHYDELLKELGHYGSVRISKYAHERVMPQGTIRIILWMEQKTEASAGESTEPESTQMEQEPTAEE